MGIHSAVAFTQVLLITLAAGVWSTAEPPRMIELDSNGTQPYREMPLYAHITEVLDIDCEDKPELSLYSVTKEDYDNCTLPVPVADGGTSIHIGDCPRVIRLVLATNVISNSVNYEVGGTYYYAAYGVNYLYEVTDANPCEEGVKFKIYIQDEDDNKEPSVDPSTTIIPTTTQTGTTGTSSVVVATTPSPTVTTDDSTSTTEPSLSSTSHVTDNTDPTRGTFTPTRPSVDTNAVIAEGVVDSAVSHQPYSSLLTSLVVLVLVLTTVNKLL